MADETPKTKKSERLSPREQLFVIHYTALWNGTRAVEKAGYKGNDNVWAVTASQLLRKPKVQRAIKERVAEIAMGPDEVLVRLAEIGRASMDDFINEHGSLDMAAAKRNGKLHLVHSFTESEKLGDKIELHNKLRALELLGKNNGALGDLKNSLLKDFDIDKLTPHQVRLLAAGEDILTILLNPQE